MAEKGKFQKVILPKAKDELIEVAVGVIVTWGVKKIKDNGPVILDNICGKAKEAAVLLKDKWDEKRLHKAISQDALL